MISFDEFKKVEMKVGRVIEAERVEGTKNLIKMIVDFGGERRQVISGIAKWYKADDLINRLLVFVTNLEPKVIRGLKSEAMVLAAEDDEGNIYLVTVDGRPKAGSRVY